MPSIDEINAAKQAALDILNAKLMDAAALRNQGVPGMAAKVSALEEQRLDLVLQAYEDAMNDLAMARALAALQAATASMKATAAQMTSATAFITHANDLIGGAKAAVSALKGG